MFEDTADGDLIDVMGEATRDESTAIAQRLLAVAELYARRVAERAECSWWVRFVTCARCASGYRRVAKVFARGTIDHTVPWPYGPTHPSNNKPYCRTHPLLWRHDWSQEERSSWTQQGRTANQGQARAERGARLK